MKAADIVLTVIPQDNQQKIRPALVLKVLPKFNDLLVCAISTQLYQLAPGFDLILVDSHPAFPKSGLKSTSLFRLGSLAVLSTEDIVGTIGVLKQDLHDKLINNLTDFLLEG
jgi:mRNA interferase MazF